MISKKALDEYRALYRKKTGKDISDQEALEQATKLITLVKAVYRPIPQTEETQRNVDKVYDILFDEVQKRKQHGDTKRDNS